MPDAHATVLVFAGVDPRGAAGLTRDLWALGRAGVRSTAIPSCLTVQSTSVRRVDRVDPEWLEAAWSSGVEDPGVAAVKIGLVVHEDAWRIALPSLRRLSERGVPIVVDPVRGPSDASFEVEAAVRELLRNEVADVATVLTPNLPELAWLADGESPAHDLLDHGYEAIYVKGGHGDDPDTCADRFVSGDEDLVWRRPRRPETRRGTGCVLASFLAAGLAEGLDPKTSARVAAHRLGQVWDELDAS